MVRLRNLKKSDKIGECDIIPEDSKQAGHITVNYCIYQMMINVVSMKRKRLMQIGQ